MPFIDDEISQDNAEPIELYSFVAGATNYRYTSGPVDYSYGGQTYTRVPIQRSSIKIVQTREKSEVVVKMPIDVPLIQAEGMDVPANNLSMTIRRIHPSTGNTEIIWRGQVTSINIKGRMADVVCPPNLAVQLDAASPPRAFTRFCNNQLFDARCGLNRLDHDYSNTVATVTGNVIVITADSGDPNSPQNKGPVQRFSGGEMKRDADGEYRRIVRQGDYVTSGAYPGVPTDATLARTFYLNMPFRTLNPGDTITIFPGCSKSAYECKAKFNNIAKFSGYPLIPLKNVFTAIGGVKGVD